MGAPCSGATGDGQLQSPHRASRLQTAELVFRWVSNASDHAGPSSCTQRKLEFIRDQENSMNSRDQFSNLYIATFGLDLELFMSAYGITLLAPYMIPNDAIRIYKMVHYLCMMRSNSSHH